MSALSPVVTGLYYAALALGSLCLLVIAVIIAALAIDVVTEFARPRRARRKLAAGRPQPAPARPADDTLALLAGMRRRDDDTFLGDGLRAEIDRMLAEGDGRG